MGDATNGTKSISWTIDTLVDSPGVNAALTLSPYIDTSPKTDDEIVLESKSKSCSTDHGQGPDWSILGSSSGTTSLRLGGRRGT